MQRTSEPDIWEERSLWRVQSNFFKMHFFLSLKIYIFWLIILYPTIYIWLPYSMNTKQFLSMLEFLYVLDFLPLMNRKPSLHWTWGEWNMSMIKVEWVIVQRPPGLKKNKVKWHFPPIHDPFRFCIDRHRYDSINACFSEFGYGSVLRAWMLNLILWCNKHCTVCTKLSNLKAVCCFFTTLCWKWGGSC